MMASQVKAEFHDIGKLINWQAVGLFTPGDEGGEPHEFERCVESEAARKEWGVELKGAAWEAIVRKDNFKALRTSSWPDSLAWWHTSYGDYLAAGYGRDISEAEARTVKGDPEPVYCLWSGLSASGQAKLFSRADVEEMIRFLNSDPTWEEAITKYESLFKNRPEQQRPGLNVTTLLRHSETTGKLARIISEAAPEGLKPDGTWAEERFKGNDCQLTVAHYRIEFPQKPYRARDLNVFRLVEDTLNNLENDFADNVLSRFENQAILVFAKDDDVARWEQRIWNEGLIAQRKHHRQSLMQYTKNGIVKFGESGFNSRFPPELPKTISLPICENCQMERATKQWPKDHDAFRVDEPNEDLCQRCFDLRKRGEPLKKLAEKWREGTVAWIHAPLDFEDAREALTQLHRNYLKSVAPSCPNEIVEKLEATFPLIADFIEAYKAFLDDFDCSLRVWLGEDNVEERVSDALWCIRLDGKSEATKLIGDIFCLLREHFPKLLEREFSAPMPIRIGISISNPKHPFFSHWEAIADPEAELAIQLVGSGRAAFRLKDTPRVLESLKSVTPSAVHRLAAVAGISESLAKLVMKDNSERGMDMTAIGRLVPDVLDFESVRALINLSEKGSRDG